MKYALINKSCNICRILCYPSYKVSKIAACLQNGEVRNSVRCQLTVKAKRFRQNIFNVSKTVAIYIRGIHTTKDGVELAQRFILPRIFRSAFDDD